MSATTAPANSATATIFRMVSRGYTSSWLDAMAEYEIARAEWEALPGEAEETNEAWLVMADLQFHMIGEMPAPDAGALLWKMEALWGDDPGGSYSRHVPQIMADAHRLLGKGELDILLAAIPALPRAVLARLAAHMIERLDELDGDPDLEEPGDHEAAHGEHRGTP